MMGGYWRAEGGAVIDHPALMAEMAKAPVVLLGERHDRADHHRWQAHVIAGLAAQRALVVGCEMFPASADPVLDDWIAGGLDEAAFLDRVGWKDCWGFDPELYMPIFRLCRDLRIPLVGLNVPRALVRAVGAGGWDSVPDEARAGLTPASPSPLAYRRFIFDLTGGARPDRVATSAEDPAFDRFLRAQEVWDRAFATHIRRASLRDGNPLVVGIIGMGHLQHGGGVSWQLADLGLTGSRVLIPQDAGDPPLASGAADACWLLPPIHQSPVVQSQARSAAVQSSAA